MATKINPFHELNTFACHLDAQHLQTFQRYIRKHKKNVSFNKFNYLCQCDGEKPMGGDCCKTDMGFRIVYIRIFSSIYRNVAVFF